jgi:Domain of unknown function (DUF4268)
MFRIDSEKNEIAKLDNKSFSQLGFTERYHLQEWLAKEPSALGEDLLIIQKEFDGFEDTKERLDLLALDKEGNLVIIENKLDDTGRDVVWQALKYASYCSSMTKLQVVDIFQSYLNKYCAGGDANNLLCEFFDIPDLGEFRINSGNDQRLIFVAANYRKEVTSTALWLISHGIQVQCFRVTPYALGSELLLNVDQIIPPPEAKELMIGMSAKEADEKHTEDELKNRHRLRLEFWEQALEAMKASSCDLFNNINPTKDHWLSAGSGVRACPFQMIFGTREARVELSMARSDAAENKLIFDDMAEHKDAIEQDFGESLHWLRMDEKKASRIQYSQEFDGYNKTNWPAIIEWLVEHMMRLEACLKQPLSEANSNMKSGTNVHLLTDSSGT